MLLRLLLAFTIIPAVELALLIWLHHLVQSWYFTLGIIFLTGAIGSFLAKRQGWRAWASIKRALAEGRIPGDELMHGFLILIAGALLITPGILTDITGFLLLLPQFRRFIGKRLMGYLQRKLKVNTSVFTTINNMNRGTDRLAPQPDDDVIDVEAKVEGGSDLDDAPEIDKTLDR